jgi:hypothetical protein
MMYPHAVERAWGKEESYSGGRPLSNRRYSDDYLDEKLTKLAHQGSPVEQY